MNDNRDEHFLKNLRRKACILSLCKIIEINISWVGQSIKSSTFQEAGVALTEEEVGLNEQVFKETIANEFPNEDMTDKTFRDKVIMMIDYVGDGRDEDGDGVGHSCIVISLFVDIFVRVLAIQIQNTTMTWAKNGKFRR